MSTNAKLLDPALRALRAKMFIERRVMKAMSVPAIAEEFHVTPKTVTNEIDWAKRQNLLAAYEDQILDGLVPAAIKTFKNSLENNDAQVALEVLKGVGLLRKPSDKPLAAPAQQEDSLEIHIKRIRGTNTPALTASEATAFIEGSLSQDSGPGAPRAQACLGPSSLESGDALDGELVADAADSPRLPFEPATS